VAQEPRRPPRDRGDGSHRWRVLWPEEPNQSGRLKQFAEGLSQLCGWKGGEPAVSQALVAALLRAMMSGYLEGTLANKGARFVATVGCGVGGGQQRQGRFGQAPFPASRVADRDDLESALSRSLHENACTGRGRGVWPDAEPSLRIEWRWRCGSLSSGSDAARDGKLPQLRLRRVRRPVTVSGIMRAAHSQRGIRVGEPHNA
jgi:hypothetical protein